MQVPDLILTDHRRFAAAALKNTGRAIQQCAFPFVNHRWMHAEPARQFRHGRLAIQRLQCHLGLNSGACCFPFDIFDLHRGEDQQTAN